MMEHAFGATIPVGHRVPGRRATDVISRVPRTRRIIILSQVDLTASPIDVASLARRGAAEIVVGGSIPLASLNAHARMCLLATLRDALSHNIDVTWTLQGAIAAGLIDQLSHLPPPTRAEDGGEVDAAEWNARHIYGQFYWRKGPGFVLIRDRRPHRPSVRIVLNSPLELSVFERCHEPRHTAEVRAGAATVLAALAVEGILLEDGDHVLALPSRMRSWPIPYMAV